MTYKIESSIQKVVKGVFYDGPVQGLEYQTLTTSGITNKKGEFEYREGETVTFSVAGLVLGTARGSNRITPADLVTEFVGDIRKLKLKKVTNLAKFIQSLNSGSNLENGNTITDEEKKIIRKYRYLINFEQKEEDFEADPNVKALFAELKLTLRTSAQARNQLRRSLMHIRRTVDVKIPTRDGSYLLADIYYPTEEGRYPALVSLGTFGKALMVHMGMNYSSKLEDVLIYEQEQDKYFEGNPEGLPAVENHGTPTTTYWVPQGYALVKIDERGAGETPGKFEQFSLQEARDFYDAIEWTAKQPWCNGKVGTWGFSYYAMTQWNMAQLQPPGLKAIMPIFGNVDSYRDYVYNGGLFSHVSHIKKNASGEWNGVDWPAIARANPFYDPAIYGPQGKATISPDMSKITVPLWSVMPLEYFNINTRGSSEGYIHAASKNKKLTIVGDSWSAWPYTQEALESAKAFFDYWLKGIDNGIMDQPPVKLMVRTGGGGYFWLAEKEWPIARTQYTKYYLDAAPSSYKGDAQRKGFLKISPTLPARELSTAYSSEVKIGVDPAWSHGVSFITEPLAEDVLLAGYIKLGMWVSSTSSDMDIVADIRIIDEDGFEVPYSLTNLWGGLRRPVAIGWLKVSHRKTDPDKSTTYRPWHTHLKADYQPLKAGEIVSVEVEIWPTTALVKKGQRIRLDVLPTDGEGHPDTHHYEETYHKGASNTIYSGPDHPSYLQLPVIPAKKAS